MSLFAALNARVSKGTSIVSSFGASDPGRPAPPTRSLSFSPGPISTVMSTRQRDFEDLFPMSGLTHSLQSDPELGLKTIDENSPTRDYEMSTISSTRGSEKNADAISGGITRVRRMIT